MQSLFQYSWLVLFAPLFAFAVIIFGTRMGDLLSRPRAEVPITHHGHHSADEHDGHSGGHDDQDFDDDPKVPQLTPWARNSGYVAIAIMAIACLYTWIMLLTTIASPEQQLHASTQVFSYDWVVFGLGKDAIHYTVAFHLDTLAIAMMVVVTTVTLLVQIYSQGYMENSAGYARFFSYLSLFAFSMLVIVFAQNFLVIFIGWELVGLSSYLLIGFWINKRAKPDEQRPSPASASLQAFVMNRIGDVGFIIGIMLLFASTGTFDFQQLFAAADAHQINQTLLIIAMICIFCGAIGKSAQIPLHTWLPSAMEGPTPVSALIHAATMVAAGVYMVARTLPLYQAAGPIALQTVAWTGGITALFAATIALVQSDFKRVLAFSTISQLGYMFVGLGIGGTEYGAGPGMFHLFTHAFFKALLFLGAGSVLHSLHHATHREVQDMRLMGGLGPKMPWTAGTWLIATMAIAGFPFLSGFYSKEFIIGRALEQGDIALYIITLLTAGLTAFYMLRAFILAFGGKGGKFAGLWGGTYRGEGDPHESPWSMRIALIVLAFFSLVAGYWVTFFTYIAPGNPEIHNLPMGTLLISWDTWLGVAVSFAGLGLAWWMYGVYEPAKLKARVENSVVLSMLHRLLYNRYYVDDLYNAIVRYIVFGIAYAAQAFDTYIVDGIVNGVAKVITGFGGGLRRVETGRVQSYMIGFFGGIVVLALVVGLMLWSHL